MHNQHQEPAECTLLFLSQGTKGHWVFTNAAREDCSSALSDPTACLWRSMWAAQGHQHCSRTQANLNSFLVCLQPELHGMIPCQDGQFTTLQQAASRWPNSLKQCAAVCNSLNRISAQQVVGDHADFTAFKACEARFLVQTGQTLQAAQFGFGKVWN